MEGKEVVLEVFPELGKDRVTLKDLIVYTCLEPGLPSYLRHQNAADFF